MHLSNGSFSSMEKKLVSAGAQSEECGPVLQLRLRTCPSLTLPSTPQTHQGWLISFLLLSSTSTEEIKDWSQHISSFKNMCNLIKVGNIFDGWTQVNLSGCLFVTDEFVNQLVQLIGAKSRLQVWGMFFDLHQVSYCQVADFCDIKSWRHTWSSFWWNWLQG